MWSNDYPLIHDYVNIIKNPIVHTMTNHIEIMYTI